MKIFANDLTLHNFFDIDNFREYVAQKLSDEQINVIDSLSDEYIENTAETMGGLDFHEKLEDEIDIFVTRAQQEIIRRLLNS